MGIAIVIALQILIGCCIVPAPQKASTQSLGLAGCMPAQVAPEMLRKAIQDGSEGVVRAQALVKDGVVKEVTILSGPRVFHVAVKAAKMQGRCAVDEQKFLPCRSSSSNRSEST